MLYTFNGNLGTGTYFSKGFFLVNTAAIDLVTFYKFLLYQVFVCSWNPSQDLLASG